VRGGVVGVEIRLRIPQRENHVVIAASMLPHHFEPRAACILAAVRGEPPEKRIHGAESSW